jgi:hypothetical protein
MVCPVYDRAPCPGRGPPDRFHRHQAAPRCAEQDRCRGFEFAYSCVSRAPCPAPRGLCGTLLGDLQPPANGRSPLPSGNLSRNATTRHHLAAELQRTLMASRVAGSGRAAVHSWFDRPGSFDLPRREGQPLPLLLEWLDTTPACSAYPACHLRQSVKNGHKIAERPVGGTNPTRANSRPPGPFPAVSRALLRA